MTSTLAWGRALKTAHRKARRVREYLSTAVLVERVQERDAITTSMVGVDLCAAEVICPEEVCGE